MTPIAYAENVASRFGGKLPGWHELAALENTLMRRTMGLQPGRFGLAFGGACITAEMRAALSARALETGRQRMEDLLAILTAPMTCEDMVTATGWSYSTVKRALNRARVEGLVAECGKRKPAIWERVK